MPMSSSDTEEVPSLGYPDSYWDLTELAAAQSPEVVVLEDDYGRSLTCRELRDGAEAFAKTLSAWGVGPGTVVSWQLPSTLEAMVVMVALTRLGAVQNPIVPILREHEVQFITSQARTEFFVTADEWRGFDHAELAQKIGDSVGFKVLVIEQATPPQPGAPLRLNVQTVLELPSSPGAISADEVRWIYFSSGTTAEPKGALHTDPSVMAGAAGVVGMVGVDSSDVNPLAFPISHIGGAAMLAAALLSGMRLVLFDSFDPSTSPARIAAHQPTLLGSATPFFVAFIEAQRKMGSEKMFPRLRACLGGGAPTTPELNRQVREVLGAPGIANAWGLTEFPVATSPRPDAPADVLSGTVGHPVPGVLIRVVGDLGECALGEVGELRLKGPQCFKGYLNASLDAEAFDEEGWFRTGDLGLIDSDGNTRVTGRIKDAIIRNAENISAQEVEEALVTHPSVADVAVIGLPDPRTGEMVCAVVVLEAGHTVDLAILAEHCTELGLAKYKCPEALEVLEFLPRNPAGKVLKRDIRDRFS
jgi:acyl-CoA synthetase (AMP-forming)/AMP-acid ligase II